MVGILQARKPAESKDEVFKQVDQVLMGRGGESMVADDLLAHIVTKVTDEGLVLELSDTQNAPLFDDQSRPTETMKRLASVIVRVSGLVTNPLAIEGHVRTFPIVLAKDPTWDASENRAGRYAATSAGPRSDPTSVSHVSPPMLTARTSEDEPDGCAQQPDRGDLPAGGRDRREVVRILDVSAPLSRRAYLLPRRISRYSRKACP